MCFNRERRKKWKDSEKEKRRGTNKKPLVFGRGHLLHSRDCENGRRECVCVCVYACESLCVSVMSRVCVWCKRVCQFMCFAVAYREGGRPMLLSPPEYSGTKDEHLKCLLLISIHVKMPPHSTHAM